MIETRVNEKAFERFPDFRRGIVIARDLDNSGSSKELEALLQDAVSRREVSPIDLKEDPRTAVWNEAYRALGCNPNKYPPAHLALLKRIQKGGARIPFINKVVSIMNYNSIIGVLPVGGDDVLQAGTTLELRLADGTERFTPLDTPEKVETPEPGEIIYVVSGTGEVMCRRWNWRNGYQTRITEGTQSLVMNIDGLGEEAESRAVEVRDRVARMLERFCGAKVRTALLEPSNPSFRLEG